MKYHMNPFYTCAEQNNRDMYHDLIRRGITPLTVPAAGVHPLAFAFESLEFFEFVVQSIPTFDPEGKCISEKDNHGNNIFNHLFKSGGKIYLIAYLSDRYEEIYLSTHLDEADFVEVARSALYYPAKNSQHRMIFKHPLFQTLHQRSREACLTNMLTRDKASLFTNGLNSTLKAPLRQLKTQNPGMCRAVIRYLSILSNPQTVKDLLTRLSKELSREIANAGKTTAFENTSTAFAYEAVHHYLYPIPKSDYQKINKDSLLTELLLKILKTADLGGRATKWVGFIEENISNARIYAGDLFLESQFGIGVFHGKYAHMIQWVILIYAIEAGLFADLTNPNAKSIIQCLVTTKDEKGVYLWVYAIDSLQKVYTFCDPYRLTSLITTGHFGPHCRTLEVYLRDSFCDSYLQWFNAYNQECDDKLTTSDFAKFNSVCNISSFAFTHYLIEANYQRNSDKIENPTRKRERSLTLFKDHEKNDVATIIEKTPRGLKP